jgi:hypothetical protein
MYLISLSEAILTGSDRYTVGSGEVSIVKMG